MKKIKKKNNEIKNKKTKNIGQYSFIKVKKLEKKS